MSNADDYKLLNKRELRDLCAYKDGTIEILTAALNRQHQKPSLGVVPPAAPMPYCDVTFGSGPRYTYRTGGMYLKPGDVVIVPVGRYHYERTAAVVDVHYRHRDDVILKTVIRRDRNLV